MERMSVIFQDENSSMETSSRISASYRDITSTCTRFIELIHRDEGLIFVDPTLLIASERQTRMKLRQNLPLAPLSVLRQVHKMYPSPSSSKGEYAHQFDRVNALISGPHPTPQRSPNIQNGSSTATPGTSPKPTPTKRTTTATVSVLVSMPQTCFSRSWTSNLIGGANVR